MNLALIGYGRMGHEVEQVARERGLKILKVFEIGENERGAALTRASLKGVDVCIDFSAQEGVYENICAVAETGANMVVGTTGWYDRLEEVRALVKKKKMGFLFASNFSLGVNIFLQIIMDASHIFDAYPEYDVAVNEIHHQGKSDSPSGTALSIGSTILKEFHRKKEILAETSHGAIKSHQLHIGSTRLGHTTGKHSVIFDSESDSIEFIHTAKNRRGFAVGAVVAAEWLKGKKGFYTMRDVLHT
ncbi:MAG: 4-hydroxy-tetrahydrodipicolinate reductase [Bacteroidota bacterium]